VTSRAPVHFSDLKHMALSPAHYRARLDGEKRDTPAMMRGRLVHGLALGGGYQCAIYEGERRGKAWSEFKAAHPGVDIVTGEEYSEAERVATAVRQHPIAGPLLVGELETHVEWEMLGRKCSSRLDVLGDGFITDLKTSASSEPGRFSRGALRMCYHAQLAFYADAASFVGKPPREAFLVAVEPEPPYAVTVLRATPRALEEGRKLCRLWMERLLACEAANEWPEYVQAIVDLDIVEDADLIIDGEVIAA
jgi:hypothetical protein